MFESILTGAVGGVLAAAVLLGVRYAYERRLAERDLYEFSVATKEWKDSEYSDDYFTDKDQYKMICESLMQSLMDSHITQPMKMYLWHSLKQEIEIASTCLSAPEYFGRFEYDDRGNIILPEKPWAAPDRSY
ncbi:MAG: hypothetical protein J4F28_07275 [Nitrosopumilaceae archaeon]|nr:hypothetical protein [Nitrosopumilaceae archaeon]